MDGRTLANVLAAGHDANAVTLNNLGAPSSANDAATKAYVDALTRTLAQVLAAGANANGVEITNGATPTTQASLATKGYVDTLTFNAQTAGYTLVLSDAGKLVTMSSASALTLTIPLNASVAFPIGTCIYVSQAGAGTVTIAGAGGVTLVNPFSSFTTAAQYAEVRLLKTNTDTWRINGEVA